MNAEQPFTADDLAELDEQILSRAHAVVAMREVYAGNTNRDVVALRHDVDNHARAWPTAVAMAEWEAERGYRSTYFVLHTAAYWREPGFLDDVRRIAALGHEIGIHVNAIADAIRNGGEPALILREALRELRGAGLQVRGAVGHGDPFCHEHKFANAEMFTEYTRPDLGKSDRQIASVTLDPEPLASFGLDYESTLLHRTIYNTDSSGRWYTPFDETVEAFTRSVEMSSTKARQKPKVAGQLHLLIHPDWWSEALL